MNHRMNQPVSQPPHHQAGLRLCRVTQNVFSFQAGDVLTCQTAVTLEHGRFYVVPAVSDLEHDMGYNLTRCERGVLLDSNGVPVPASGAALVVKARFERQVDL